VSTAEPVYVPELDDELDDDVDVEEGDVEEGDVEEGDAEEGDAEEGDAEEGELEGEMAAGLGVEVVDGDVAIWLLPVI
jgi:hypothetical protein